MSVCSKICDCESQDQKEFKLPSELDFGNKHIYIYVIFILLIQHLLVVMIKFRIGKIIHLKNGRNHICS